MKSTFVCALVLVSVGLVAGLDVDEAELRSVGRTSVEWINYEGPHRKTETREEIEAVGLYLGRDIDVVYGVFDYAGKYRVIHAVDPDEPDGLDADIFIILPSAEVDHIDNIRLMLKGFLKSGYGYADADARLLAQFITVYNAVYRGHFEYFLGTYKPIVTRNITRDNAGIATVYSEWPGATRMVIPLTDGAQRERFGALDTDSLTEPEVIDRLREEEDRGLPDRKEMTELKEREVEEEQRVIEEEREALRDVREEVARDRERAVEERERLDEERRQAVREDDRETVERIERREDELAREEEEMQDRERDIQDAEEELAMREERQQERIERIQEEREEIAREERELIEQDVPVTERTTRAAAAAVPSRAVLFLEQQRVGAEVLGRLVIVDLGSGSVVRRSRLNTIRGRAYHHLGDRIIVVAGSTEGRGAVRLVALDNESLEAIAEGDVDVSPDSQVAIDGERIYATVADGDGWKVAQFDETLTLRQRSTVDVFSATVVVVSGDQVLLQGVDGALLRLNSGSLQELGGVE